MYQLMKSRAIRRVAAITACGALIGSVSACSDTSSTEQARDQLHSQNSKVTKNQKAETLEYSYSRQNVNFWIKTWGKHSGKLAYTYLMNNAGEPVGYFITDGPPVSYCAMINPPFDVENPHGDGNVVVPEPGTDDVYYTGSGSCNTYYGRDAISGAYVEFTVGNGMNYLLFDKPMNYFGDAKSLGPSTLKNVKK